MSPLTARHADLEKLLGSFVGDPALGALEDRAHDAAHLEESHYDALLQVGEMADEDEELRNLKRHVLFCDLCAKEFLERVAPEVEAEYTRLDAERVLQETHQDRARWLWRVALVGVLAIGALLILRPWEDDTPDPVLANRFPATIDRAALGRVLRRPDAPDRLFITVAARGVSSPLHLFAFVVADDRVIPIHPALDGTFLNPITGGSYPTTGWPDPGGSRPRVLLALLTTGPVPLLTTSAEMTARAQELTRTLASPNRNVEDAARILGELLGTRFGKAFVVPIEE
ncbi:MAG: hypothetical protein CMJ83_21185 [Planctomycetes bacterium]|nr:hypothetical protein [Planctomycetota bacterium]